VCGGRDDLRYVKDVGSASKGGKSDLFLGMKAEKEEDRERKGGVPTSNRWKGGDGVAGSADNQ